MAKHSAFRETVGAAAVFFGAGILFSWMLPGFFLAFIEAALLVAAGILLVGGRKH